MTESVILPAWACAEYERLRAERDEARLEVMLLRAVLEHHGLRVIDEMACTNGEHTAPPLPPASLPNVTVTKGFGGGKYGRRIPDTRSTVDPRFRDPGKPGRWGAGG